MKSHRMLIVGCGVIGTRVGLNAVANGWEVAALRRRVGELPEAFHRLAGDYSKAEQLTAAATFQADAVVFTPVPAGRDAAGYQRGYVEAVTAMVEAGVFAACQRAVMVSSTRVYAESAGAWVDETSPVSQDDEPAQQIAAAESAFLNVLDGAVDRGLQGASVLRASGIYGGWPGMLLSRVARGQMSPNRSRISNRVHRDDLVGAIDFIVGREQPAPGILNVTDSLPIAIGDVEQWLAGQLGISLSPAETGVTTARGNRRCSNRALLDLGYRLKFPDFRAGYGDLLRRYEAKLPELMGTSQ